MIASSTLRAPSVLFLLIPDFLWNKLTLLLLTTWLSSSQLYSSIQPTILPLTLTSVILFLLLELSGNEVHVEKFLLPLGQVRKEVFVMCHGLAEVSGDAIQDNIDEVMVGYLGIDIESIDIIQVFLDSTCVFEITYLVKSPVRLIVVTIVFPNGILNLLLSIEPILVRFPPFQCISFYT